MFRVNILRNCSNFTKNLLLNQQQNGIKYFKSPLSNSSLKFPLGKSVFDNVKAQKPLLQVARSFVLKTVQIRGTATVGDHTRMWQIEKILSAALIPLLPGIFLIDSKILESLLASIVVVHTYWGFESIIADYLRPIVVGPTAPKVARMSLNVVCVVTLGGLLVLIFSGDGIADAFRKVWKIGKESH